VNTATKTATSTSTTSLTPSGVSLGRRVLDAGPVLALVLMVVVFSVISGRFLTVPNAGSIANQASILLVLAVGSTFVILLGGIDLSIEGVMATSSLVTVLLAHNDRNGLDLGYLAVLVGAAVGAVFGLVNGLLHTRMRIPSFMVTLGTGAIGIGIATVLFGGQPPRLLDDGLRAWGTERVAGFPRLLLIAVLVLALGYLIQRLTRIGRYILVIGGDEQIAKLSGVSVPRYKVYAFVLSGTASGLAGAMASTQLGVGDVQVGAGQMFATITAVVVGGTALTGGRGGVLQTLIGVLLISVLANGLILVGVNPSIQRSVQGVVIVLAIAATAWTQRHRLRVIK
jgi:ribose transport system permease protein